jgi:histidine phosphotransferase ChpT
MPDLMLLSLLCSKLCHDLVGPISAIGNGVEILEDEDDPEMRKQAIELLAHSAELAAIRLKFMRLAFGAAGGEGVAISLAEARRTAADFFWPAVGASWIGRPRTTMAFWDRTNPASKIC